MVSTTADVVPCGMFSNPTKPRIAVDSSERQLKRMMIQFLLSLRVQNGSRSMDTVTPKPMMVLGMPEMLSASVVVAAKRSWIARGWNCIQNSRREPITSAAKRIQSGLFLKSSFMLSAKESFSVSARAVSASAAFTSAGEVSDSAISPATPPSPLSARAAASCASMSSRFLSSSS